MAIVLPKDEGDNERLNERLKELEKEGFSVIHLTDILSNAYDPERLKSRLKRAELLLKLPVHLRETYVALEKVGEGTAKEVSLYTQRARAVESSYLNQLVRMDLVKKSRREYKKGNPVYFSPTEIFSE